MAAVIALLAAGCSPALDWRDVSFGAGSQSAEVQALFPCKPLRAARRLPLGDSEVNYALAACEAGGMNFSLGGADVGDPARVGAALDAMRERLVQRLGAPAQQAAAFVPQGASALPQSQRFAVEGRQAGPGGQPQAVALRGAVFARGTRVYQAVVLAEGRPLNADAAEQFFSAIHCP